MFGFGFFSSHVPYLILLIGYIVCWLWNIQYPGEELNCAEASIQTEQTQAEYHCTYSDHGGIDIFSMPNLKENSLTDAFSFSYFFKPQLPHTTVCIDSDRLLKVLRTNFFFLRPPPSC